MAQAASFDISEDGPDRVLALRGDWTVAGVAGLDDKLRALAERIGPGAVVDVSRLGRMDVAGAWLVDRTVRGGSPCGNMDAPIALRGEHASALRLLHAARASTTPCELPPTPGSGLVDLLERAGRGVMLVWEETLGTLSFFGETLAVVGKVFLKPHRIRWVSVFNVMEYAGLNALPIIAMLAFFVGMVIAYLGARVLADFGASVFTVELVAFSMMREFGVVITAVLLAGRTDSAFTAQIGAMKMRQEIDAMRVMGLDPMEALVAPRVLAMLVMTPILAFAAVVAGLAGGLVACWATLDVSVSMYFQRIADGVPQQHFWVGMAKSPVFAIVLAVVGCRHGLAVGGDVASLGRRTTSSVVQSIFLVIMLDALFALWFLEMDL
ncbi:MAG: MlaE family lipid ABC transporter permease subunit [Alphaproteobacteria bacterium]|nr:MlaE family lipid ABC transporter permease subunit [Alphaproteobacteria bacterium]